MIPLMKNAFLKEQETKKKLSEFILHADRLSMGKYCARFEKEFSAFQGAEEAILFNSGASANLAMIQASKNLGLLKNGDKVGFSALTWATNVMPIIQLGLKPIPIDCWPRTLNVMSHNLVERLMEIEIQGLFITNALGFAGDLNAIKQICKERNIFFIEDNCEALGTELNNGKTGNFGTMASFSFYVAHHMSTIEGGMVCTNDSELAEMLRIVRANGWDRDLNKNQKEKWHTKYLRSDFATKYTFYDLGYNLRPTEITGFLGHCQLKYLKNAINMREKNYITLEVAVENNPDLIELDRSYISLLSSFAFPVLCRSSKIRDKYLVRFINSDIEIRPMIAGNIQKQPFYRKYITESYNLPGTNEIHERGFYCGNYPELTKIDIQTICDCLAIEEN